MKKKIDRIMLVDDNPDDNFFHERVIKKYDGNILVIAFTSGEKAIAYLKSISTSIVPQVILLDVNMPTMNGWEFLKEYGKLEMTLRKGTRVIMLTTSDDPEEIKKASESDLIEGFKTKPLTNDILASIAKGLY